jgi:hypothetical protein
MFALQFLLDITAILGALAAAWLWFAASQNRVRRISKDEVISSADLNRIVVSINRSQILNSRAALATAISALAVTFRLVIDLF